MYEYTRSDFLRALLNQKKALNANSNSLVNPSLPQADNIANLAALNTSFSGTTSTPAPENVDTERNDWQRTIDTAREFGSNITEGVLGFLDGISDAIAYGYGAISGDQSGALDWMNYDWQAQTLNALNQLDLAGNVATGDIFSKDYWDNWQTVGSAAQSRDQINRLHQNSWTSELGEKQQMYNTITQGIGSALPSIVLGIVTGGMSSVAQAAITMGTMGVSAFGGGAAEALNDGASYGQAAAYGGVSAGIEMLTETISGTIGGVATSFLKKGQQKVVKEVAEEGFKKIAKATIKEMMSEGLEETVSTLANPLAKAATYKGTEAFKEYGTPDLWIEAAVSFASGALGGGVGSTASRVHLTNTYSKQGLQALDALNNANELEKEYVKRISSGESVETLSEEYGVEYSYNIKKAVEIIQKMQKSDTAHYTKLMEAITGNSSKTTSINEYDEIVEKGLKPRVDETITQRYAKNIGSRIGVDINLVEDSMLQNAEAFMKATGIELTPEQIQQFNDPTTVKKGLNIDGKVYISDAYQNDINQLIMHEAISHGYLDSNKELRESLMMSITSNGKLLTKLKEIKDETYKAYGLDKIQVLKDLDARKTSASDVHASETVAKFLEFLYSNNDISSVLNSLNKSKLSSMLSRAISYLKTKGNAAAKARLQLEKILSKIKLTKDTTTPKLAFSKITKGMSDDERYELLKNERLNVIQSQKNKKISEKFNETLTELYKTNEKQAQKTLMKKYAESIGLFDKVYHIVGNTNLSAMFTREGLAESVQNSKNVHLFPYILENFQEILDNSVKIDEELDYYDNENINVHTLISAVKINNLELVKITLKEYIDKNPNDNRLYVVANIDTIKKEEFLHTTAVSNTRTTDLRYFASSTISISDIFKEVNSKLLRHIPDKFLSDEQIILKKEYVKEYAKTVKEKKEKREQKRKEREEKRKIQKEAYQTTSQIKFSKVKNPTSSTTQTTNTAPKVKSSTYSDFFNVDGTINADWVKRGARANYGNLIGLKTSGHMIRAALETISNSFTGLADVSLDEINVIAREFFEQYNVSDGQALRNKAFDTLLGKLLNAKVTFKINNQQLTLKEILSSTPELTNYKGVNEFKTEMANLINQMIRSYGQPTKLQNAYNKFKLRTEIYKQAVLEHAKAIAENAILTTDSIDIMKKIDKKFSEHQIKAHVGVLIPELTFIRELAGSIRQNKSFKTLSPASIDRIIKAFEKYKYEPNSKTLEALGLEFNQSWYDMYTALKAKQKPDKVTKEIKFPNRALHLDETRMVNSFLKELRKTLQEIQDDRVVTMREKLSKATSEINIVSSTIDINDKASILGKEFDYFSSPDVRLRRIYGANSEVVRICYDQLLHAYYYAQGKAQTFVNAYWEMVKKHKVKNQLTKTVKLTLNGKTYNLQNDLLLDIYLHSLATENRQVLLNSGYTFEYNNRNVSIKFTDEMLQQVESKLSSELKAMGNELLDYYNTTLKEYAKKSGIEVLDNVVYYPLSRNDVANTTPDTIAQQFRALNPDTLPINQRRTRNSGKTLQGSGIGERLASYASQVSRIGEMSEAMDEYSKFLNTKVLDENNNRVSRNELMKRIDGEWTKWKTYIEYQLLGIPIENKLNDSEIMGNLVASTLGWNISTLLKQTASIPTILTEVHFSSWLKGLSGIKNVTNYQEIKQFLMKASPLLNKRFSTNEVAEAHLLSSKLSEFSKFFMKPIEKMDEAVILTFCYQTAMYEAQLEGAGKVGTTANHKRAMEILEKIVLNTQSNSVAPKMSMARSGYAGTRRKVFSYFTSDLNNIINKISECATSLQTAKRNVEAIEAKIKNVKEALAKATTQEQIDSLNLELKNLNELLKENQVYASGKRKWEEVGKLIAVLVMKALMVSGIVQLVDRLYGRKGWTENTTEEFFLDLLLESTINNLPYMQTIVNSWDYDQEIGTFELTGINDSLSALKDVANQIEKGQFNATSTIISALTVAGQWTGIPFKNIYNLVFGVWKNIDASGYSVDAYLRGYSDSYILQQYKTSVEVGRTNQANGYLDILLKNNKVSTTSTRVQQELMSFTKDGYNAMPKNFMTSYIDENGNEVNLTDDQIKMFRTAYNESNKAIEALMNVTEYKTLTQEEKAKQIKKIYDLYYSYAKAKTLKTPPTGRAEKLLYYTHGKVNIGKYTNVLNTISSIKETKTKTRKELVVAYVNKLNGYSKQEKLLILHLAGYKTNEVNQSALTVYLRQNGMNVNEIKEFLGIE